MTIYVIIMEDRHSDTDVFLFSSADKAIARAKALVQEYGRYPEDIDETLTDPMKRAGWLYYGRYSCEGDHVVVLPRDVV